VPCNAKNHRQDCDCGFGGPRPGTSPETPMFRIAGKLSRRKFRSPLRSRTSCPHCGRPVFFIRGKNDGSFYMDSLDSGWSAKHLCDGLRKTSRYRVAASRWRREGWIPLAIVSTHVVESRQILSVVALDKELDFEISPMGTREINPEWPLFFRVIDELSGRIEIDYLSDVDGELEGARAEAERVNRN